VPAQVNNVLGERSREAMPMPVAGSGQGEGSGLCRRGGAGGAPLPRPLPHPAERVLVMASFGTEVNGAQMMPCTACVDMKRLHVSA